MSKLLIICSATLCVLFGYVFLGIYDFLYTVPLRPRSADENPWWGPGQPVKERAVIQKFYVNVSNSVIEDLKLRLRNSIEPHPPLEGTQQQYGLNTNYLKKVVNYWIDKYDWSERQKILNKFPQYTTKVQGLNIHFLHVLPKEEDGVKVVPILLLHGWPSSTREMFDVISLLTTRQKKRKQVFEVIAPNLPGFTFSEAAARPGLNPMQIAIMMKNLMSQLGHEKFYVHGGDWGGHILQILASLFPEKVIGLHSNFCFVNTPLAHLKVFIGGFFPSLVIDDKVRDKVYPMMDKIKYLFREAGYMHIQATKPDTLGVALTDSPIGLAAYLLEKFSVFTNPANELKEDAGLEEHFKLDDLLDNVMMYWVSRSITSSMRIYAEAFTKSYLAMNIVTIPTNVPTACPRFSNELVYQPEWVLKDKFQNLIQVTDLKGGHFAPLEVPETLAEDLYNFVEKVELSFGY